MLLVRRARRHGNSLPLCPDIVRMFTLAEEDQTSGLTRALYPILQAFDKAFEQLHASGNERVSFKPPSNNAPEELVRREARANLKAFTSEKSAEEILAALHDLLRAGCLCLQLSNVAILYLTRRQELYLSYEAQILELDSPEALYYLGNVRTTKHPANEISRLKKSLKDRMTVVQRTLQWVLHCFSIVHHPAQNISFRYPENIKCANGYAFLRSRRGVWILRPVARRHPLRRFPGTQWGKFLINMDAPLFGLPERGKAFTLTLPEPALFFQTEISNKYSALRRIFGQAGHIVDAGTPWREKQSALLQMSLRAGQRHRWFNKLDGRVRTMFALGDNRIKRSYPQKDRWIFRTLWRLNDCMFRVDDLDRRPRIRGQQQEIRRRYKPEE